MHLLLREKAEEAEDLIVQVVAKSAGGFLWVKLVVKSLDDGLKYYDRISDLKLKFELLPPKLGEIYKYMPNSMEPVYRQTASQILQIILQHHQIGSENPLTLLQLLLADEEDLELTIRMSTKPSTAEEEKARCRATHIRLLRRCCGLLEISGSMSPQASRGLFASESRRISKQVRHTAVSP